MIDALNEALAPHIFPPRADGTDPRACPTCGTGRLSLKIGKFGAFIGCSNYPECRYTRPLAEPATKGAADGGTRGARASIRPPALEVTLRSGRFGPYVQLGEAVEGEKPKRASLPKGLAPADVDLDKALTLLSLPREVGPHPEDGEPILAGIGRYRPLCPARQDLRQPRDRRRGVRDRPEPRRDADRREDRQGPERPLRRRRPAGRSAIIRTKADRRGEAGRYGPYVSHDGVNATLPTRQDARDTLTLEEAVSLLAARAGAASRRHSVAALPAPPSPNREPSRPQRRPHRRKKPARKAKAAR